MSLSFDNPKAVEIYKKKTELFPIEKQLFTTNLKGRVLDIGCGTGRTTRHIRDMGYRVEGIDISPLQIETAQTLHPDITFKVMDVANMNYWAHSFDSIVFSFNGLDYLYPIENRMKALNEIHRVLKPQGVYIFSSHDKNSIKRITLRRLKRIRHYKGAYYKENTVYGELITYYGEIKDVFRQLRSVGFQKMKYMEKDRPGWRYYVAWV